MPQVGVDYVSDPSEFIAASRAVADAGAKSLASFDLTDKKLKALAVTYLSTADSAKQAATIQRMAAVQAANDVAASSVRQVAAQRVAQTETLRSAEVQEQSTRRQSSAMSLLMAAFRPDNLRSFRGELKSTAAESAEAGGGIGALAKGAGVLAGSLVVTAAAAPLLNHAFGVIQKPAEALDKALFGDTERAKELAKQAAATSDALLKSFGVEALAGSVKTVADLGTRTKLLTASVNDLNVAADGEATKSAQVSAALGLKIKLTGQATATDKAAREAAEHNSVQAEQLQRHLESLASQLGDTGARANGYSKELALADANQVDLINAGPQAVAALAQIGNQMDATANAAANLAAASNAAQASIANLIAENLNLPPVLAKARTNAAGSAAAASIGAAAAQAGGVNQLIAQAKADDAARAAAAARSGGGGGGGGYTPVQAAKDSQNDALANLRARIQAEQQIHPSSLAYDKQLVTAAKDTLAVARAAEKHAQSVVDHAKGEKARHAALLVLHQTQSLVNAAQKDVTRLQNEGKTLAVAAAKAALELKNARLEATSNMLDQATADAVHVKEAQAALALDKKNTLDYYRDLKTYNEAVATAASDAASAAKSAKSEQISLANAMIEAGIDYSNPLSALQAAVKEAQNTLSGDQQGTTQFNLDTSAYNQAVYNLAQATAQNTVATQTNTQAMTGVLVGGQVPGYLALRGANSSAFLSRSGGSGQPIQVQVVLDGKVLAETTVDPMMQAFNSKLTFNPRALLTPTG